MLRLHARATLPLIALAIAASGERTATAQPAPLPAYKDTTRLVADRVRDLIGRMTLEEKFWQLFMSPGDLDDPAHDYSRGIFGLQIAAAPAVVSARAAKAHAERINAIQRFFVERTRLGIPIIPFEEALHGFVRQGSIAFPQAIALAATWDSTLLGRVAAAIARETRSRGVRQVLSPVVNIANDVRWGRVEETYGEDPYLASVMARAFVRAFESAGIITTPKHFVANVGDGGRDSYPIDFSRRLLEEFFFPPFRAAVQQAGARSLMTAYNSVDGRPSTQNGPLLNGTLKRDWGFSGFVISDAAATGGATVLHHTEANTPLAAKHAFEAGLDVVFQSSYEQHRPYWRAFQQGLIADSIVDAALARVLRAKFQLGLFERPFVDADSASYWNGHEAHRVLAREAARASIVLLKNERATLPLRATATLAVIGTDAQEARLGGYSGPGVQKTSILDGLRSAFRGSVRYAPGPGREETRYSVVDGRYLSSTTNGLTTPGLRGQYFDNNRLEGEARLVRSDSRIDFGWTLNSPGQGIPFDWYSARWSGLLTAPAGGVRQIGIHGNDGYRLWIDGRLLIDNWTKRSFGTRFAAVRLAAGSRHEIRLEYFESTGNARLKLVWDAGVRRDSQRLIDSAAALARRSDVAIVVAGIEEGEFRDRAFLGLPGRQEDLIRAVAATGKPLVVVLVGGSAITMSRWIDGAHAILQVWYPGEEGGHAVADVIRGAYNPAGRLPITFPMAEGQLPLVYNHKPTGRGDDYLDLSGQPLFPFGYGLSYTTFDYSGLTIERREHDLIVQCTVTNVGSVAGDEVVQLYLRDVLASVARPIMELKGFTRIRLEPGAARRVIFTLTPEHLRMLDGDMRWIVEPGVFRILVGASSKDIRLRGEVDVR